MIDVSIVIPTKDRAHCIQRALKSVLDQTNYNTEIIIVDDGSTDDTFNIIKKNQDKKDVSIKYLKNKVSVGGAIARNQGAAHAVGKYIAFLDSDDEWLPNHLSSGIKLMNENKAHGVFGSFYTKNSEGEILGNTIRSIPPHMNMADYVFSRLGDPRTSTFIFKTKYFKDVMFDEKQAKHQDWDLAIRFALKYLFVVNSEKTCMLHYDADNRMSYSLNHQATAYFLQKHERIVKPQYSVNFYFFLLGNTVKIEGKTDQFYYYLKKLEGIIKNNDISLSSKQLIKRYIFKYVPEFITKLLLKK